ncbi:MAG: aminotransferase class I/II-fold pyridoxal phosphate-dependent enzyme, partial [Bacteroidota bacterium]
SKVYGLAGVRIGYLVARPDIAARLIRNRVAYTNVLALHAAEAAMKDQAFYDFSIQKNATAKQMIYKTLDELGLEYQPSHTNFVFFKSGRPIAELNQQMLEKGVMIGRPFPPLTDWCRISTGTLEEVQRFNEALKQVLS